MVDPIIFFIITILGVSLGLMLISTQNPVYSGLYLVLLFFLGSGIAFLLGLEFIGLLFILVYAGAIAVLVLFVVMMLDVKALETPWSENKKWLLQVLGTIFLLSLVLIELDNNLEELLYTLAILCIGFVIQIEVSSLKEVFQVIYELYSFYNWFMEFDASCALNDISYLLYANYAILLIIGGIILLIAMVGAISLTLQKNCPESLYRQLGRESRKAVFVIKERTLSQKQKYLK